MGSNNLISFKIQNFLTSIFLSHVDSYLLKIFDLISIFCTSRLPANYGLRETNSRQGKILSCLSVNVTRIELTRSEVRQHLKFIK